ncbi:MAG TPA: HAD family hydrolase [Streptosporangiaceae bacterium]|nr:HAD family hydrolase [Streptosporangiaceae bacterium]
MTRITVACLDMAGTTVADDGVVMEAFTAAVTELGLGTDAFDQAMAYAQQTMGRSKIEVFRHITGDEDRAQQANAAFERHYDQAVRAGQIAPLPGAEQTLKELREAGLKVCLATGFSPATRDAILHALGWGGLIDLALSPADTGTAGFPGRGRPCPDLPLTALLRLRGDSVGSLAVVGDTPTDIECGLRAGAGLVAGVLTGMATRADFEQAGAPLILETIADLLPHVTS